jgi:hypothetical protein
VNVAVERPAPMITLAGTLTLLLLLASVIVAPPGGAAAFNVTVATDDVPPVTEVGLSEMAFRAEGFTPSVVVRLTPL